MRTTTRPPAALLRAIASLVAALVASGAAAEPPRDAPAIVRAFPSFARVPRIDLVGKPSPLEPRKNRRSR